MKKFNLETQYKITTGYQIPEDYFKHFPDKVYSQLSLEKPKEISLFALYTKKILSLAAIIVISISIPFANLFQTNKLDVSTSEIETYLTQNASIYEDDLVNLLDTEDIQNLKIETSLENETIEEQLLNNLKIEEYLTN